MDFIFVVKILSKKIFWKVFFLKYEIQKKKTEKKNLFFELKKKCRQVQVPEEKGFKLN